MAKKEDKKEVKLYNSDMSLGTKMLIKAAISSNKELIQEESNISQYDIKEKIGEGMFGKVKLAVHQLTKEKVAIKILEKNRIMEK